MHSNLSDPGLGDHGRVDSHHGPPLLMDVLHEEVRGGNGMLEDGAQHPDDEVHGRAVVVVQHRRHRLVAGKEHGFAGKVSRMTVRQVAHEIEPLQSLSGEEHGGVALLLTETMDEDLADTNLVPAGG